jgi:hypothetical protein
MFSRALMMLLIVISQLAAPDSVIDQEKNEAARRRFYGMMLDTIEMLEMEPLSEYAQEARSHVTIWIWNDPDMKLKIRYCASYLDPYLEKYTRYMTEIYAQSLYGQAAFMVKYPEYEDDDYLVLRAGLVASLRVYQSIVSTEPEERDEYMEDLIDKYSDGKLDEFVRQHMEECN